MATLTRPSESKISNNQSSSLNESVNHDLALSVPAPFPQLQPTEAPLESIPTPKQDVYREEVQATKQYLTESQARPESHPEIEIEQVKVEPVRSCCLSANIAPVTVT